MHQKPRLDVVHYLSDLCMSAIADAEVSDLTPGEVLSACFTTTKRVMVATMERSEPANIEHNKQMMLNALSDLLGVVNPTIN